VRRAFALLMVMAPLLEGCGGQVPIPLDAERVAPGQVAGWRHRRGVDADLDGDGRNEQLVIAADVALSAADQPLWEDGHRWAVFVSEPQVTLLYGAFVPNGHVEAAVLMPEAGGRRHVLVHERTPGQERAFVLAYDGPGTVRALSATTFAIEQRVPDLR
jgi:hypothetical protein